LKKLAWKKPRSRLSRRFSSLPSDAASDPNVVCSGMSNSGRSAVALHTDRESAGIGANTGARFKLIE